MQAADTILKFVEYWCYAGLALALVFLTMGIDRVDSNSRKSFIFRPLLIPGVVVLWPLVLWRWIQIATGRDRPLARHRPPREFHRMAWIVFACVIPAILVTGLIVRQDGPLERPSMRLEAPE